MISLFALLFAAVAPVSDFISPVEITFFKILILLTALLWPIYLILEIKGHAKGDPRVSDLTIAVARITERMASIGDSLERIDGKLDSMDQIIRQHEHEIAAGPKRRA